MKNVELTRDGNFLMIKVDLTKTFGPSGSGKTTIVATSEGPQNVPGEERMKIGLNVYNKK